MTTTIDRLVERLCDVDIELAQAVAEKAGAPTPAEQGRPNAGKKTNISITAYNAPKPTIATRRVAILVGDGYDSMAFDGVYAALKAAKAFPYVLGPKRQTVFADGESKSGKGIQPDHPFEGMRSTMFDSIFIPGGAHIETLQKRGRVVHWVREAFGHLKAIGATGEAVSLVKTACDVDGMRFSSVGSLDVVDSYGVVTAGAAKPQSFRETLNMVEGAKDFVNAYAFAISQHKNFDREMDGLSSMVAY